MNKRWHFVMLAFIFFALICQAMAQKAESLELSLEPVLTLGGEESMDIELWAGLCVDEAGAIYISEFKSHEIKKFVDGQLVKRAGRQGQGPGEFMTPAYMVFRAGLLYVTSIYRCGVQIFDRDLNYVGLLQGNKAVHKFDVLRDTTLVYMDVMASSKRELLFVSPLDVVKHRLSYSEESQLFYAMVDFDFIGRDLVVLAYGFRDCIACFNTDGRECWSVKLLDGKMAESNGSEMGLKLPETNYYKTIRVGPQGRIYVLGGGYSEHHSRDVYVLNGEGEHLATMVLPEPSHMIYLDDWGFLYARSLDGVALVKYRILNQGQPLYE